MNQATVFDARGIDTSFQPFAPTAVDGYKIGHANLYPEGIDFAYGNGTPRADRLFLGSKSQSKHYDHKVVWIGIQGVMREVHGFWQRTFFGIPKEKALARYSRRMTAYLGDPEANLQYLSDLHDLGHLPVTVLSIDEGERLNINVPGYVIYAFGKHFWMVNYLETIMSTLLWKMVCNATIAYEYRRVLDAAAEATGVHKDFVAVQGHDFSMRGMSGVIDAASCGFAHLGSFIGTDTLPAIDYAEDMYGANVDNEMVAISVVATEHAVATSNILYEAEQLRKEFPNLSEKELRALGEQRYIKRVITKKHPSGIISLVCDSFDFWRVVSETIPALKETILARTPDANGFAKLTVRPDSGDPVEVICGQEVFDYDTVVAVLKYSDMTKTPVTNLPADYDMDAEYAKIRYTREQRARLAGQFSNNSRFLVVKDNVIYRAFNGTFGGADDIFNQQPELVSAIDIRYKVGTHVLVPASVLPLTPEEKGAVQCLWETFGGEINNMGYATLHERIGLIYGDSITVQRAEEILLRLKNKGFASDNVIFGIGSYTYQHNTRDTFGFAVKATACRVNGELIELFKAPATEGETNKKSAKGFLKVIKEDGEFKLLQEQDLDINSLANESGELKCIYDNGVFTNPVTLGQIRTRLLG